MCRQLPGDGIEVGSGVELDGLGDPAVKQTSPGGGDLAVGNIADPVVAQVVAVRPTLADQPPLPELVQGGSDLRFVKVARHGQSVEWKVASPRRRELCKPACVRRELSESGNNHGAHSGWQRVPLGR